MAVVSLTNDNFQDNIKNLAVVDFYAEWCGPCKMLKPILEQLSDEFDNIIFGKINVEDAPDLAKEFNVMAVPTIVFISGGKAVETMVGFTSENTIKDSIKKLQEAK